MFGCYPKGGVPARPVRVNEFWLSASEARDMRAALVRAWDKEPSPRKAAALRRMIDRIPEPEKEK